MVAVRPCVYQEIAVVGPRMLTPARELRLMCGWQAGEIHSDCLALGLAQRGRDLAHHGIVAAGTGVMRQSRQNGRLRQSREGWRADPRAALEVLAVADDASRSAMPIAIVGDRATIRCRCHRHEGERHDDQREFGMHEDTPVEARHVALANGLHIVFVELSSEATRQGSHCIYDRARRRAIIDHLLGVFEWNGTIEDVDHEP